MENRRQKIIAVSILIFSVLMIVASIYYKINFSEQTFETLLYYMTNGMEGSNTEVVGEAFKICIIPLNLLIVILGFPLTSIGNKKTYLEVRFRTKKKAFQLYPNEKIIKHSRRYLAIILIFSIAFALGQIGLYEYIENQVNRSTIFEEEYVVSENIKITFPEEKRNLIYIFLESMETTLISQENGGGWEYTIIPELEQLAEENINFSNTEKLGGAVQVPGTEWTVAGLVSQTSGVSLKTTIDGNSYSGYSSFLPGVYSLGDILKEEGYNLEVMFGSDASFGGRADYFTVHGNYEIFDVNKAIEEGKMTAKDKVWWGFDDDDLFKWAKDEILELSEQEEPFNFIMLTADTHFEDGYLSENVGNEFETQYENVFAYSSKCVYEFVNWIKEQEFYENTTIVIVGDHVGMQTKFYEEHLEEGYTRTIYNTFINSSITEVNSKNRQFSSLDIFPTVLASIGVEIEGERLGLGTNLFSEELTLIEECGLYYFNEELSRRSNYYNKYILGDNYIEMLTSSTKNNVTISIQE